jgi:hypothetical protein
VPEQALDAFVDVPHNDNGTGKDPKKAISNLICALAGLPPVPEQALDAFVDVPHNDNGTEKDPKKAISNLICALAGLPPMPEQALDESVKVPVHDTLNVAGLMPSAQILDQLVRMLHVVPHLLPPLRLHLYQPLHVFTRHLIQLLTAFCFQVLRVNPKSARSYPYFHFAFEF